MDAIAIPEKVIQAWVVERVACGDLAEHVQGRDEVDAILDADSSVHLVPAFPIDYLLRRRAARAASAILAQLDSCVLVSDRRDISASQDEKLFPDLVLAFAGGEGLAAVEIKGSEKPEREAVTELLAYDFELSNHLPFGAHVDRALIVIATDFKPLLEHAVSSLIVWGGREVLCLAYTSYAGKPVLRVHLPSAWTRIGQLGLPSRALRTVSLAVHADPEDEEAIEELVRMAFTRVVREAERLGSHGFGLVCRRRGTGARWALIFGVVDPWAMLELSLEHEFLAEGDDALTRWFVAAGPRKRRGPPSLHATAQIAHDMLDPLTQVVLEPTMGWRETWASVRDQGRIGLADFWGVLGDYARELSWHPGLGKERSGEIGVSVDWQAPAFAITLLNDLAGRVLFNEGFKLLKLFRFGVDVGSYAATLTQVSATGHSEEELDDLLGWHACELLPSVRAINVRYLAAVDIDEPPPFVLPDLERATEATGALTTWREWLVDHFLAGHGLAQFAFVSGFELARLLDDAGRGSVDPTQVDADVARARAVVSRLVREIAEALNDWVGPEKDAQVARDAVQRLVTKLPLEQDALTAAINVLPGAKVAEVVRTLFAALDALVPPVAHRLGEVPKMNFDWEWLRSQVIAAHASGDTTVGLMLAGDGQFGVYQMPPQISALKAYDPSTVVAVGVDNGGSLLIRLVPWKALQEQGLAAFDIHSKPSRAPRA